LAYIISKSYIKRHCCRSHLSSSCPATLMLLSVEN
jgi:hypothetical protein